MTMDEAYKYFAAQVADADRMEKLKSATGFQNSKVYEHFSSQLSNARRMDEKKKFKAQLDILDKEHKFIILRSLPGYDYKSQMRRSNILEKLYLIYDNLCSATGEKASPQYHEEKPIDFTNKKIKACQDCGGAFSLESGSAELTCMNCGRIEILDGTAFALRKTYNVSRTTRKYTFKYRLNRLLDSCNLLPTQLFPDQINEANCIFEHIEGQLPKKICYPFVI